MIYIVVPYRAGPMEERRKEHLEKFKAHMASFLPEAVIVIAEQSQGRLFNRGALLNAAVRALVPAEDDRIIFHDVDLLPSVEMQQWYRSEDPIVHVASVWKRYDSASYLGGVLLMKFGIFRDVNGFPNDFYGWGGEDDELRDRILYHGHTITKPYEGTGSFIDLEGMDLREKLQDLRRKSSKCMIKKELRSRYKAIRQHESRVQGHATVEGYMQCNHYVEVDEKSSDSMLISLKVNI